MNQIKTWPCDCIVNKTLGGFMKASLLNKLSIIASSLILISCSQNTTTSFSAEVSDGARTTSNIKDKAILFCNQSTSNSIKMNSMVYSENNQIRPDFIWMNISQLPSQFEQGQYIQIYRWKADTNTAPYIDTTPLKFRMISKSNHQISTGYANFARWNELSATAHQMGEASASGFFQNSNLLIDLKDYRAEFDAIRLVFYNSDGSVAQAIDHLIPSFYASPLHYAFEDNGKSRSNSLQALHPFVGQSSTDAYHFVTISQNFCEALY